MRLDCNSATRIYSAIRIVKIDVDVADIGGFDTLLGWKAHAF